MVLPLQKFLFGTGLSSPEIRRRFLLMVEQRVGFTKKSPGWRSRAKKSAPSFSGMMEQNRFLLVALKPGGEEDLVQLKGTVTPRGTQHVVEIRTSFTGLWLTELVAGLVVALVAAYMYGFIGMKVFLWDNAVGFTPYVIAISAGFWINLRRYSRRAEVLIEQLMQWLEMEELEEEER